MAAMTVRVPDWLLPLLWCSFLTRRERPMSAYGNSSVNDVLERYTPASFNPFSCALEWLWLTERQDRGTAILAVIVCVKFI